ncbi:hypothetical protein TSMEX_003325 [Taenia solium]|eukprot:TsM_001216700 transcript=TsM_001216700 gene=TsM_001216700
MQGREVTLFCHGIKAGLFAVSILQSLQAIQVHFSARADQLPLRLGRYKWHRVWPDQGCPIPADGPEGPRVSNEDTMKSGSL